MFVFETPKSLTGSKSNPEQLSLEYILSKSELEIELNEISDRLQHPTTIIEYKEANKRTDSTRSRILFAYCCDVFRTVCGWKLCTLCDENHAALFRGVDITDEQFEKIIQDRINSDNHTDSRYKNNKADPPMYITHSNDSNFKKGYLKYDCPIMGLRELIFPIIIEQRILGVMFVGQIQINSLDVQEKIKNIRKQFIESNDKIFEKYQSVYPDKSNNMIIDELMRLDDPRQNKSKFDFIPDSKPPKGYINIIREAAISLGDYNKLIKKVISEIYKLERKLTKKLNKKREIYVKSIFDNISSLNYREMQQELRTEGTYTQEYWNKIKENLKNILPLLGLQYISIYTSNPRKGNLIKTLDLTVCVHNDNNEKAKDDFSFDFQEININNENIQIYSTMELNTVKTDIKIDKNLYSCIIINGEINNTPMDRSCDIFLYPVRTDIDSSVAIIIGYQENNNPEYFSDIKHLIGKEIPQLITLISLITVFLQNVNSKRILRIYRHEISHLALGLRNNIDWYFAKPKRRIKGINDNDLIDTIYQDNSGSIQQLNYFTQNTGMMLGSYTKENLKKEEFKIFRELLFKWEKIYRDEAYTKNLEFILPETYLNDEQRPLIYSNKQRFEQLIYNLVNNAIKYSYWGTQIHIDCKTILGDSSKQCLSITDYGYGIDEGDIPYQLYFRSENTYNRNTEGSGIGLYVAREVAKLLDFTLAHKKPEKISEYNVPLMHLYLNCASKNDINYCKVREAHDDLDKNNELLCILSHRPRYRMLPKRQVITDITLPTYKVTFEVII